MTFNERGRVLVANANHALAAETVKRLINRYCDVRHWLAAARPF